MGAMERLVARLPQISEEEREALLCEAEDMLLALTQRAVLPGGLITAQVQLAVVLYNRRGIEGQTAHSEGGVSCSMEGIPQDILRQAAPYRLARIARFSTHETL